MRKQVVVIDNYDSFTYNLVQYLEELGVTCDVRLNDATTADSVFASMPQGVVLSPGPGSPPEAGITLDVLSRMAGICPVLGVCLGHQAIGHHFGAQIRRANRPVHGKASAIEHTGLGVFHNLPSPFAGARYHSLVVDEEALPACLEITARTQDGHIMGLRHRYQDIQGVQFHPESILSEHGKTLLANWVAAL